MKKYETERLIIKPTNTEDTEFIFEKIKITYGCAVLTFCAKTAQP